VPPPAREWPPTPTMSEKSNPRLNQPLSGIRILVGRARHQAEALSTELRKLGAAVIEIPFIEIRKPRSFKPLDSALGNLGSYDWLILTSANGVEAMWKRMEKLRLGKAKLDMVRTAAIGPATKRAIEQRGIKVDVVPKEYVAESVVRRLKNKVKGKRVLLVRAKIARDVIPRELRRVGAQVDVVEAYETVLPESSRARLKNILRSRSRFPDVITFTSSSTVRNFVDLLGGPRVAAKMLGAERGQEWPRQTVQLASIGPVTSSTLWELGLPVDISASEYTIAGLVRAIASSSNRLLS
jgi:uroporphyrinogen-III synthase